MQTSMENINSFIFLCIQQYAKAIFVQNNAWKSTCNLSKLKIESKLNLS